MDTLAVIVNYNDRKNVHLCVASLLGQAKIVVWDNGSTDDSVSALRASFKDKIIVHEAAENMLWTPAINGGIEKYLTDETSILVSNNDILYQSDTIQLLNNVLTDPTVGIVAPIGSGLGAMQDFASHHGATSHPRSWPNFARTLPTIRVAYVVGASMMIPTRIWNEIGPFDNTMPLGADDHDYCIRVKHAGYKVMICQSAYISHKSHASFGKAKSSWDEWGGKSWAAFNEKWVGYYHTEQEAIFCHWGCEYHPGWDYGTGRMTDEERQPIWETRNA